MVLYEVVNVFLEVRHVSLVLGHESHHPLDRHFLDVVVIGAQRDVQIVLAIVQENLIVLSRDSVGHHAHSVLFVASDEAAPNVLVVVVEQIHGLRPDHFLSDGL